MNKIFISGIFLAIILGIVFPFGDKIKFLISILLAIILFFNFYEIDFKIKNFLKIELLIGMIAGIIILPLPVFFLSKSLLISFRIGLFLIAITPTAIGASIMVKMLNGDTVFSTAYTVFINFLSIIYFPLLLHIYFGNENVNIPFFNIFINLSQIIIIPFIISYIMKKIKFADNVLSKISKFINYLFLIVVYIAVSSSVLNIKNISLINLLFITFFTVLVAILYFTAGFILGRNFQLRKTLSSCMGQKNTGLCILVAITNFNPITSIPATVYIIVHHIINVLLIMIYNGKYFKKDKYTVIKDE
jgi:bile acid:Na+ symporter, BASS family